MFDVVVVTLTHRHNAVRGLLLLLLLCGGMTIDEYTRVNERTRQAGAGQDGKRQVLLETEPAV